MNPKAWDNTTPVLVLNCKLGGLAIMRSLGVLGVPLYGVDAVPRSAGLVSRYCREGYIKKYDETQSEAYLDFVLRLGQRLGKGTILIPTSDDLSIFVAQHSQALGEYFVFPRNDEGLVKDLVSKEGMYKLALKHGVPTPHTIFPRSLEEVSVFSEAVKYPVMLKGIDGNRLQLRTGKKMVVVPSRQALIENYKILEDPDLPNLMIQEYIPGGDDQIFIFNGYFNADSQCLAAFTGRKIRQYPVHVGCASLGECRWFQKVADCTVEFMRVLGYRGILDIGYRWDPRDNLYKVLDINPRVGQAFRLFVATSGMDVVRVLYRDLTGQKVGPVEPIEGRRWVIEDYDLESSFDYYQEGTLRWGEWIRSYRGVQECAWFDWRDLRPFFLMCGALLKRALRWRPSAG